MRNYIKVWVATEYITLHKQDFGPINTFGYQVAGSVEDCLAAIDADRQQQLNQNQFLTPPDYYTFDASVPEPRWFEMNKANLLEIITAFDAIFNTSLFVSESPRETWSHGK